MKTVTISRRAARYLADTLRVTIESHTHPSPAIRKLTGWAFVAEVTSLHEAEKNPTVTDGETDLQWFQRELFPVYLEVCEVLAGTRAADRDKSRKRAA